ncbi:hypothetical protein [Niabella drilacis]|uniref:Alpha-L-rhamnosidase six-hairpin glycosidase domain-containing protein n=1 Tax=Niabella drilacis (strain DSM 25811 / CCM 8410 / CCUG 62505 / LMG 26954 / E90) TaxID=1285928 RepID=A0A1G6R667_NIADE|nr:hypothetical protein [Niabella drilacis]SDC99893.1 hypothetical protein SAMN04487894_105155 [Niabella drilacis]
MKDSLRYLFFLAIGLGSWFCHNAGAQSFAMVDRWLKPLNGRLQVSIRKYEGTALTEEHIATEQQPGLPDGWQVQLNVRPVKDTRGVLDITAVFTLTKGISRATAVNVDFDFSGWSRNNYVLVPAIVYNGNRYSAIGNGYNPDYPKDLYYNPRVPLTISNNPRLSIEPGKASLVELQTGNTATPALCYYAPAKQKAFMVLTEQRSAYGNHGLTIAENAAGDQCRFSITAPAMRRQAPGFGDFHPSGDKAPDWKAGDQLALHFRICIMPATGIPDLLTGFMRHRKDISGPNQPRNWLPMSYYAGLATTITSNNFRAFPVGSYYLPENSKDFQLGWVSGMMNTYPMLALNNAKERARVAAELDFVVTKLQGRSGYFYGGITADGKIRPEKMNPAFPEVQAMVRKNADALLWLLKHLMLLKAQGYEASVKPGWETAAKKLAAAFARTWKQDGQFGQYIAPATGRIAVYNSTAGAIVPAGLAIASGYFKNKEWLQVAKESAEYYYQRDVVKQGLTGGDCGDISMDANSESAFGFLESLMALYHYTGDKSWLRKAEVQAALCASWTISYDPVFPAGSQIGKLGSKMAGAVWASIQNKHAAPGICTASGDYLFKLFRATGNPLYADLIRDIQHAQAEAVNIPPDHMTTNNLVGSSMERIQPSDAEGKGAIGNYINTRNSWTETNGALMAIELPGIYVQPDKKVIRVFDHVEARIVKAGKEGITLAVKNNTRYDASVSVFAENSRQAAKPLSYTAFTGWPKVAVRAGGEVLVQIGQNGKLFIH